MKKISLSIICLLIAASANTMEVSANTMEASASASPIPFNQKPLEEIAPYPAADAGMSRQVIFLEPKENEHEFRVELLIGKTFEVDCNHHLLGGNLETRTLSGWGYKYLVMESLSQLASTRMACPDNNRHSQFITANLGDAAMQRYNSRLPIVIYVPQDAIVKYRIWEASQDVRSAQVK